MSSGDPGAFGSVYRLLSGGRYSDTRNRFELERPG